MIGEVHTRNNQAVCASPQQHCWDAAALPRAVHQLYRQLQPTHSATIHCLIQCLPHTAVCGCCTGLARVTPLPC
jgi:hypothetical protein